MWKTLAGRHGTSKLCYGPVGDLSTPHTQRNVTLLGKGEASVFADSHWCPTSRDVVCRVQVVLLIG